MKDIFDRFAQRTARAVGSHYAFIVAASIVIIWIITGPIFHFNDTWQLAINTGTTIVTFLMVFLIQNTQNRDTLSIHIKLDEIIRGSDKARNKIIDLDDMNEDEMEGVLEELEKEAHK